MPEPRQYRRAPAVPASPAPQVNGAVPKTTPVVGTVAGAVEAKPTKKPAEPRDTVREVVETIVFVVVLVVMLKMFVAEAFVIPTGSMAETLYGYQFQVDCPACKHSFPVNGSGEVDPQHGERRDVSRAICPNCDLTIEWSQRRDVNGKLIDPPDWIGRPGWGGGDRVLVAKFLYDDEHLLEPSAHDVVVFKYPVHPLQSGVAMNYIKRMEGSPRQTIAIFAGDLYASGKLQYEDEKKYPRQRYKKDPGTCLKFPEDAGSVKLPIRGPEDLWQPMNMFPNADEAVDLFHASRDRAIQGKPGEDDFVFVRRPLAKIDSMKRIVYDNDSQAADLAAAGVPPRWQEEAQGTWTPDDAKLPRTFALVSKPGEGERWLRYHNLRTTRTWTSQDPAVNAGNLWKTPAKDAISNPVETFVDNSMGYNTSDNRSKGEDNGWVSDLLLDCTAEIGDISSEGRLVLELDRAADRFQVRFDLTDGGCSLWRVNKDGESRLDDAEQKRPTAISKPGTYQLRFLNVDHRLTVLVNGSPIFGEGVAYSPSKIDEPTKADERPAAIAARGADVKVSHLKLWRDTYYTLVDPYKLIIKADSKVRTFYVQPGHFLCLGDNSAASSDSRYWGLVPARLMLGRAMSIYYPISRIRVIK